MGHDLPPPLWPQIIDAVAAHAAEHRLTTSTRSTPMGPLAGITVIEIAGIGPGPFCGMMLADMGADVIRIDRAQAVQRRRPRAARPPTCWPAAAGRSASTSRTPTASRSCSRWSRQADALIEGFRPGVTERLGIGPDVCLARNPRLVYGRMTGWGQDGPLRVDRRPRHQLHRARRARSTRSGAGARRRCRRSTWSATSAAAACCSPSASCAALLEAQRVGPGPGRRRGHGRRRRRRS